MADNIFGVGVPPFPSTSAIIKKGDEILVIELSYKNGYSLPGGVLKGREDFEQAIKREIKEETGLTSTSCQYFGSFSGADDYQTSCVVFVVEVEGELRGSKEGKPVWKLPEEILDKLVYEDNRKAVRKFLDK